MNRLRSQTVRFREHRKDSSLGRWKHTVDVRASRTHLIHVVFLIGKKTNGSVLDRLEAKSIESSNVIEANEWWIH